MTNPNPPLSRGQRRAGTGLGGLLVGLGLLYGLAPEWIEHLYGLTIPEQNHYGMHYAVGVRDGVYGLLLLVLTVQEQRRALITAIGLAILLPLGDAAIVLFHEGAGLLAASPHLAGLVALTTIWLWVRR